MGIGIVALLLLIPNLSSFSSQGIQWNPKLTGNDNPVVIQKVVIPMNIPADNTMPWGSVWGTVTNPAPGYPVIIEIYKDGKPVHFAQTDVNSDGSYNYYFRVRDVEGDKVINIFQGDYTVEIFKTVNVGPAVTAA